MRILILSRTPWNCSNSFGNTFSNLFGGMKDVEVYNICCQNGSTTNKVVHHTLQMSESSILRSIKGGNVYIETSIGQDATREKKINDAVRRHKSMFLLCMRDVVWMIGARQWKKAVRCFIREVKPDIVYLPVYASLYMCMIGTYIAKCSNKPVVGHISDDIWNYSHSCSRFSMSHIYRWWLRRYEKRLIESMAYLEVFAENMKDEYEKIFHKPCYLIGKGVNKKDVSFPQAPNYYGDKVHFVYTGGIGGERFTVLVELGKALGRQTIRQCVLDIYTTTPLTRNMREQMQQVGTMAYYGAVSGDKVARIQNKGDYLVHVEGFSEESVFNARMSFSTKIIDYLSVGHTLFAIGPSCINSIQVLKKNGLGIVVDDMERLDEVLLDLLSGRIDTAEMQNRAYHYLTTERLLPDIQQGIKERMENQLNR